MLSADDEARAIDELIERLHKQFPESPPETVRPIVHASYDEFKGRPIRDFVPVLVERSAKTRLRTETCTLTDHMAN